MLDGGRDQAQGLRRAMAQARGGGGADDDGNGGLMSVMAFPVATDAGASWLVPLAHSLRELGLRPVVLDAVRGGHLTRAFGLRPSRYELLDMLEGRASFDDVAQVTPGGVHVLRAERGVEAFATSGAPAAQLYAGFSRLSHGLDTVLLAMPPAELACLAAPARAVPVLALPGDDSGLLDTYATVKQMAEGFGYSRFALVASGHDGARGDEGMRRARLAHERFAAAARSFLGADVQLAGLMPTGADPAALGRIAELASTLLDTAATRITRASLQGQA